MTLTVAQLIEKLQALPPEAQHCVVEWTNFVDQWPDKGYYDHYILSDVKAQWKEVSRNIGFFPSHKSRKFVVEMELDYD